MSARVKLGRWAFWSDISQAPTPGRLGRIRSSLLQSWSDSPELGQDRSISPEIGRNGSTIDRCLPTLAKSAPKLVKSLTLSRHPRIYQVGLGNLFTDELRISPLQNRLPTKISARSSLLTGVFLAGAVPQGATANPDLQARTISACTNPPC